MMACNAIADKGVFSSGAPVVKTYGGAAVMSQGVRLVRMPNLDTTMKAAQIHTAARPYSAPRA
jgi:hypothetical protein